MLIDDDDYHDNDNWWWGWCECFFYFFLYHSDAIQITAISLASIAKNLDLQQLAISRCYSIQPQAFRYAASQFIPHRLLTYTLNKLLDHYHFHSKSVFSKVLEYKQQDRATCSTMLHCNLQTECCSHYHPACNNFSLLQRDERVSTSETKLHNEILLLLGVEMRVIFTPSATYNATCLKNSLISFSLCTKMKSLVKLEVYGLLNTDGVDLLKRELPGININSCLFSTIARPVSYKYDGTIWGIRCER